ncbi:MAG: archaea-specific SMC-related protein [Haloferacaceae archaeon]
MSQEDTLENGRIDDRARLTVTDLGGISEARVTLTEGVTLVSGANASNKSSLLRALAGVLGGPRPPLKSDADAGSVRLTVDGAEYYLRLGRTETGVTVTDAERYSEASDLCELFVALTENNPIRRATLSGDDLYPLLMRPVDTAEIRADIRRLLAERRSIDERLEEIDALEDRLPGLRTRRETLRERLADVETTLAEKRQAVEDVERERDTEEETVAAELRDKRAERTDVESRIATHEDAVESLRAELDEVTERLSEATPEGSADDVEEIEAELDRLRRQKRHLTSTINALGPVVEMNEQLLDGPDEVPEEMVSGGVVDELDPDTRTVTCWTCGSSVDRAEIARQVDAVREILEENRAEREAVAERIESLAERRRELERRAEEREELRTRRDRIREEIADREETLAALREEREAVEAEIETLRERVEAASGTDERLSEYYDEISDLEYERGRLTNDIEEVESELADVESAVAERPDLEDRRESVAEELRDRRARIETIERDLVSTFNEVMQQVLDALDYRSIERIWLERITTGDEPSAETEFELHVVRTAEDGAAYEGSVDNLAKSEREVIGLVVGLAGYLVHDVADEVPFVVIDAVEMFDADRLRRLIERFRDPADYVVAAVLPEEGDELDAVHDTITMPPSAADD